MHHPRNYNEGFTLIELLIVLVVMSILIAPTVHLSVHKFQEDKLQIAVAEVNDLFQSAQNFAAEQSGKWPGEEDNCHSAIEVLQSGTTDNYLPDFSVRTPYGTDLATSCTTGSGKRFNVVIDALTEAEARLLEGYLPSSSVVGSKVTVSVPLPASIPALTHLLPRDGSRPMTGDLSMGGNKILDVENVEFPEIGTTSAEGIYFAGVVGNNALIRKNRCPDGLSPKPILTPVGYSDNGTANPVGAVHAWAEDVNANHWRARLRLSVQRNGNWVQMHPNATHGQLAVFLKCE